MGDRRNSCKILTAEPIGKRLLGRPRRRWEDKLEYILKKGVSIYGLIQQKIRMETL